MSKKFDGVLNYLLDRLDTATQTYAVATLHDNKEFTHLARERKEECRQDVIKLIQIELLFYKHEIASLSGNDDIYDGE